MVRQKVNKLNKDMSRTKKLKNELGKQLNKTRSSLNKKDINKEKDVPILVDQIKKNHVTYFSTTYRVKYCRN